MNKIRISIAVLFLIFISPTFSLYCLCSPTSNELTVVIDPGHGGSNHGANYNGWQEEDITLTTAIALKKKLEEYNNVDVYLTRDSNISLSLEERAAFSKQMNADILISIHYNASENHDLYGTEVWIPSSGKNYYLAKGLGETLLNKYAENSYYDRCVKTKIGENGKDYYGIIRNAAEYSIPAIIMEHCFIDNPTDETTLNADQIELFGIWDAEAIAEYYGLPYKTEPELSYKPYANMPSYTEYDNITVYDDQTAPTDAAVKILGEQNSKTSEIELTAYDNESKIIYYSYSTNNGLDWSELKKWDGDNSCIFSADLSSCDVLYARIYNCFDLFTECSLPIVKKSEVSTSALTTTPPLPETESDAYEDTTQPYTATTSEITEHKTATHLLFISLFFLICSLTFLILGNRQI